MRSSDHDIAAIRNAAFVVFVVLMVIAITSSKLGVSLTGAIAFWGIVLALASVVVPFSVILFGR